VLGVTLNIAEADNSAIGGDDMKFYVNVYDKDCGSFQRITNVETIIVRTIDPDYIIMLEEITIPSMILD